MATVIRRATPEDGEAVGRVFVRARTEMPYLPRIPDEHRDGLGAMFVERDEVWVAETEDVVVAFAGLGEDELTNLYVDPEFQGRGQGAALLEHAKLLRPDGLGFWVFQRNQGARRFYERHGFRLVKVTDGATNMEREPDAWYEWRP